MVLALLHDRQSCEPRACNFLEFLCIRDLLNLVQSPTLFYIIFVSDCNHNERIAWQWKDTCSKTHQGT